MRPPTRAERLAETVEHAALRLVSGAAGVVLFAQRRLEHRRARATALNR